MTGSMADLKANLTMAAFTPETLASTPQTHRHTKSIKFDIRPAYEQLKNLNLTGSVAILEQDCSLIEEDRSHATAATHRTLNNHTETPEASGFLPLMLP